MNRQFSVKRTILLIPLVAFIATVAFVISAENVNAETIAEGQCGENAIWTLDDQGVLSISGEGAMYDYASAGSEIGGDYKTSIHTVSIEDGITTIGKCSFQDFKGLVTVSIPNTVKSIGDDAFSSCSSLEGIMLPDSLQTIGSTAFSKCTSLTDITIPCNVSNIGSRIIEGCGNLVYIQLECPGSGLHLLSGSLNYEVIIYYPENDVFWDDEMKAYYGAKATWIGRGTIEVETIAEGQCGENATWTLNNLGELTVDGTGPMDDYSHNSPDIPWISYLKNNLLTVTIKSGITRIGSCAFDGAREVRKIQLAESVEEIGNRAFTSAKVGEIVFPNNIKSIEYSAFQSCSNLEEITIPGGITQIGLSAFQSCEKLEKVTIQEGVTEIGGSMFAYCSHLREITMPETIKKINSSAFTGCAKLATITIPKKVLSIDGGAFSGCSSLESIYLECSPPGYITNAFSGFTGTIYYPGNDEFWDDETRNAWAPEATWVPSGEIEVNTIAEGECGENATWSLNSQGVLTIRGTGKMDDYALKPGAYTPWNDYHSSIRKIVIENGITRIGSYIWSSGSASIGQQSPLKSVEISETVTEIGAFAFYGAVDLEALSLPTELRKIEKNAFSWSGLQEIVIPGTVESIGHSAFAYCKQLEKATIESGITIVGSWVFGECTNLEKVELPNTVEIIEYGAFVECGNLEKIQLPDSLELIGEGAFLDCSSLKRIVFPSKIKSIGIRAFDECESLEMIVFNGSAPKAYTENANNTFPDFSGTAYYPVGDSTWNEQTRKDWAPNATWKDSNTIVYDATGDTSIVDNGTKTKTTITDEEVQSVVEEVEFVKPKKVLVNAKLSSGTSKVKLCTTQIPASLARAASDVGASFMVDSVVGTIELDNKTIDAAVPDNAQSINLNIRYDGVSSDKLTLDHTVEFKTNGSGEPVYNIDLAGEAVITVPTPPGALKTDVIEAFWLENQGGVHMMAASTRVLSATRSGNKVKIRTSSMGRIQSTSNNSKNIKVKASNLTYNGKARKPSGVKVLVSSKTLTRGTDYKVVTKTVTKGVGKKTVTVKCSSKYNNKKVSGKFYINPKKPAKPKITVGKGSIKVVMSKFSVTGGSKYEIQYKVAGTKKWKKKTVSSNKATIKSLKKGKKYVVKVRAKKNNRVSSFSKAKTSAIIK